IVPAGITIEAPCPDVWRDDQAVPLLSDGAPVDIAVPVAIFLDRKLLGERINRPGRLEEQNIGVLREGNVVNAHKAVETVALGFAPSLPVVLAIVVRNPKATRLKFVFFLGDFPQSFAPSLGVMDKFHHTASSLRSYASSCQCGMRSFR